MKKNRYPTVIFISHMKMKVGDIHKTNSKVFIALPLGCVIIVSCVTEDFDYLDILQNAKLSDYMYNILLINGDFTQMPW